MDRNWESDAMLNCLRLIEIFGGQSRRLHDYDAPGGETHGVEIEPIGDQLKASLAYAVRFERYYNINQCPIRASVSRYLHYLPISGPI